MNAIHERPERSILTQILWTIPVVSAFAAMAALFWLGMTAIQARHLGPVAAMVAIVAYSAAVLIAVAIVYELAPRVTGCTPSPAMARCRRRQILAASIYVTLLSMAIPVRLFLQSQTLLAYALALLTALPVVAMVAAMGLYLREETDEFERAVNVEGALWATGGILAVTTMWGFAELLAGAPRLPLWLLFPAWAVMFSFGVMISRRRFR